MRPRCSCAVASTLMASFYPPRERSNLCLAACVHSPPRRCGTSHYGDFYENKVTGEFAVILRGDEDRSPGQSGLAHLTVRPHGAVAGEHVHPQITERFAVISGVLGTRIGGVERELRAGEE